MPQDAIWLSFSITVANFCAQVIPQITHSRGGWTITCVKPYRSCREQRWPRRCGTAKSPEISSFFLIGPVTTAAEEGFWEWLILCVKPQSIHERVSPRRMKIDQTGSSKNLNHGDTESRSFMIFLCVSVSPWFASGFSTRPREFIFISDHRDLRDFFSMGSVFSVAKKVFYSPL